MSTRVSILRPLTGTYAAALRQTPGKSVRVSRNGAPGWLGHAIPANKGIRAKEFQRPRRSQRTGGALSPESPWHRPAVFESQTGSLISSARRRDLALSIALFHGWFMRWTRKAIASLFCVFLSLPSVSASSADEKVMRPSTRFSSKLYIRSPFRTVKGFLYM